MPITVFCPLCFFFFLPELGTEPRALRLLGKRSTTELNLQPPPLCFLYKKVFSVSKVILHHVLHLLEGVSAMCIINYLKYQFLILINLRGGNSCCF